MNAVGPHQHSKIIDPHHQELLAIEKDVSSMHIQTVRAKLKLASVHARMGEMDKAAAIYRESRNKFLKYSGAVVEGYFEVTLNLGSCERVGGKDFEAEKALMSWLPDTGPNRQHVYWKNYIEKAVDELKELYKAPGREADAGKLDQWLEGNTAPLLEIKHAKLGPLPWSQRIGEEDEVPNRVVEVLDGNENFNMAAALLDTSSKAGD